MEDLHEYPRQDEMWPRTMRSLQAASASLATAITEEQCQAIGLVCRETLVSLAQAVTPAEIKDLDGAAVSPTDAKRRLEDFIGRSSSGASHKEERVFARSCEKLASKITHLRTATPREAALCVVATEATVRIVRLMAGLEYGGAAIQMGFAIIGSPRKIRVSAAHSHDLPSARHRQRLRAELERQQSGWQHPLGSLLPTIVKVSKGFGYGTPLEACSVEELQKQLEDCDVTKWRSRDDYVRFEEKGLLFNLSLLNGGQQFIDDALLVLDIPKVPGLAVSMKIPPKPESNAGVWTPTIPTGIRAPAGISTYPQVRELPDRWIVSSRVGTLRHQVVTPAFGESLRVSITEEASGCVLAMRAALHGRQVPTPIEVDLLIDVDSTIGESNKLMET